MPTGPSALFIEPDGSFGPTISVVWVFLVGWCVTGLFAFALWRMLVYRRRALRALSVAREPQKLAAGPVLLSGRVETDGGGPAVRIEIDQLGREWANKGSYSHEWKEQNRTVHVQPFRLRLASGEVVHVDPGENVRLVDTLETEKAEGLYRRRVSELSCNESVWVSGVLAEEAQKSGPTTAYRAGPGAMVVRGTAMEPLEVASGRLDSQFAYWRRFYVWAAALLGVAFFIVQGFLFAPFHVLFFAGKTEMVNVVSTSTYITKSKNSSREHYVVHARLPEKAGGAPLKDDVSFGTYEEARAGTLTRVPFTYAPAMPWLHSIGTYADLTIWAAIVAAVLTLFAALIFSLARRHAMPWYEQKRVIERGVGRLEEGAWRRQIPGKPGLFDQGPLPPPPKKK